MSITRRHLVFLAVAALLVDVAAVAISSRIPEPRVFANYTIQRQVALTGQRGDVDIALMGTSLIGAGVDPTVLRERLPGNPSVFNAAVGGGGPLLLRHWAADLVVPSLAPDIVIIGIGARDSNDSFPGPERTERDYLGSKGRERLVGDSDWFGRADEALEQHIGIFGLRTAYREPASAASYILNGSGSWRRATDDSGRIVFFEDLEYDATAGEAPIAADDPLANYSVGTRNLPSIGDAITVLQESGATVVLLDMPRVESALEVAIGRDGIESYERSLVSLADEFEVELLQGDEWISEASMFADRHHLNAAGTLEFSIALARELAATSPNSG